jgi:spore coat protein U-like protein
MRKYLLPIVAVAGLASASSAFAATASGTFNVQVTIVKACAVSATAVNFGSLSTVLGTETSNSTVTVTCNPGTAYSLSFVSGSAGLTTTGNLVNGTNTIGASYDLGTAAASSGTGSGTGTVKVSLSAASYPATGLYQATQTVYVNY